MIVKIDEQRSDTPSEEKPPEDNGGLEALLSGNLQIDSTYSAFQGIRGERKGTQLGSLTRSGIGPNASLTYTRPGTIQPVNVTANIKTGMDYFQSQGWSKEVSSGIISNGIAESGLNPDEVGDGGLARRTFQWHPDRLGPLETAYANDPRMGAAPDDTPFLRDCKMMNYELKYGPEKKHGLILQQQTTAADAGATFSRLVERPLYKDMEMTVRAAKAEGVLAGINRTETLAVNDKLNGLGDLKTWHAKRVANDPMAPGNNTPKSASKIEEAEGNKGAQSAANTGGPQIGGMAARAKQLGADMHLRPLSGLTGLLS